MRDCINLVLMRPGVGASWLTQLTHHSTESCLRREIKLENYSQLTTGVSGQHVSSFGYKDMDITCLLSQY